MIGPKRIQQKRTKGWRKPPNTVSVARPSKWGNPWRVSRGPRGGWDVINLDLIWWSWYATKPLAVEAAVDRFRASIDPEMRALIRAELAGKNLMCFCPLDQPCHADVLLELAERGGVMITPKQAKLTKAQERAAYEAVTERDKDTCVRCGRVGDVERDHRQNRDPFNTVPSNLQCLGGPFSCGCHLWKTEHPAAAIEEGFACPGWARPEFWPAWRHDVQSWVLYYNVPDSQGRWWSELTESTAALLMNGGHQ